MIIQTLEKAGIKDLTKVFNDSFSDYLIPVQLSESQLESKIISDGIQLNLSVGKYENEKLIGFILYGLDESDDNRIAYNAGTGVIPDKRGQKIASQLMDFSLKLFQREKIASIRLEVITNNTRAFNLYHQSGFNIIRELNCYRGMIETPHSDNYMIQQLDTFDWNFIPSFWNSTPSWQNSISTIKRIKEHVTGIGAFEDHQLRGYLIYNPNSKRIHQFGVDPHFRHQGIAQSLFYFIANKHKSEFSMINIDQSDRSTNEFLTKAGFTRTIKQFEMACSL